ncbi:unnamed protein product [Trichogramma brassicae]|uniref:Fatty acid desaturase domain-containing protein n=1 Tax=Trichogramma brassicae TaxID=86971 RepID=A0A6H5J551_9HYME|nr:unnamed protein product [Trichogramma brassicae]
MAPDVTDQPAVNNNDLVAESDRSDDAASSAVATAEPTEFDDDDVDYGKDEASAESFEWRDVKWLNSIFMASVHLLALHGLLTTDYARQWRTFLWAMSLGFCVSLGVSAGTHRLFTHRSYKAGPGLRLFLVLGHILSGQHKIYNWVRDHRVHHKFSETFADPHDSRRGFFFAHLGWMMLKKHPEVLAKGRKIDMSDIVADPVVRLCDRYFMPLFLSATLLATAVPVYCWNEDWYSSFVLQVVRILWSLHSVTSLNSFAHLVGNKPYDKNIAPCENRFMFYIGFGEGWHNYHHVFPSDYRVADFGLGRFDATSRFIEWCAARNWASDLRVAADETVRRNDEESRRRQPRGGQSRDRLTCTAAAAAPAVGRRRNNNNNNNNRI